MPSKLVHAKSKSSLPHANAYARIAKSPIHGVGVFAIREIPKGTNIFLGDASKMKWINKDELEGLDSELRRLYDDFCVKKGDKLGCPENFNNITIGWYLNESKDKPNVRCTEDYDFIANRTIKKGEELLVDYSTFGDVPE